MSDERPVTGIAENGMMTRAPQEIVTAVIEAMEQSFAWAGPISAAVVALATIEGLGYGYVKAPGLSLPSTPTDQRP